MLRRSGLRSGAHSRAPDKEYAGEWRKRIDPDRAWKQMPEPGDPWRYEGRSDGPADRGRPAVLRSEPEPDTSYVWPGRAEGRISDETIQELRRIGHTIERWPDFIGTAGAPCMIKAERELGILVGGADPRRMSYAIGW